MEEKLTFDRLIAMHRNKYDYVQSPENTLQLAYGDRRYVKMTFELFNADDILVKKTLEELNLDLRRADNTKLMLLSSDLLSVLIIHFLNPDDVIRELASRALVEVCNVALGRQKVIENANVHDLVVLISDEVNKIRENGYKAMLNLAEFQEGKDHFLLSEALSVLVDKLVEEPEVYIKIMALELIYSALQAEGGTEQILKTPSIKRLTDLLDHENNNIRRLAALNLGSISFLNVGKKEVIDQGCVKKLCQRLEDPQSEVREAASLSLASLAQMNECKHQILDYKYLEKIIDLLNDQSEQTRLNIVQLISSCAEHPVGREVSKSCLEKLNEMLQDKENEFLYEYIKMTIEVIQWIP